MCTQHGSTPRSVADALRQMGADLDFLNSPAGEIDGTACGQVLTALGQIQAKFTAAHAAVLRRFDAADAHDSDGYGTSSRWLTAMAQMTRRDAKAAVGEMRRLAAYPGIARALAAGQVSRSFGLEIIGLAAKLPAELRGPTATILLNAAVAGAGLDDLTVIAAAALAQWKSRHPDPGDDGGFDDRSVAVGTTFGGAGVLRGSLTPECAAALTAMLDALGKKQGPEDTRTDRQRFHDALQLGCELLIRANMIPGRAGADTHVNVHIGLGQLLALPGGSAVEAAWLAGRAGEPGYLTGADATTAACDALTIPVVTGHADMTIIDRIIELALAHATGTAGADPGRPAGLSAEAHAALRYAIARLAVDFLSGPTGLASVLRTSLLDAPYNSASLPLDIGYAGNIPAHIRRAVTLRDKHCAWPHCDQPPAYCDVHHLHHKKDGGKTSVSECVLLCQLCRRRHKEHYAEFVVMPCG